MCPCEVEFRIWPASCFDFDRPGQNHHFRLRVTSYNSTQFHYRDYYSMNLYRSDKFKYLLVQRKLYQLTECIRIEFVNKDFFNE
jgi:hypothetical protein